MNVFEVPKYIINDLDKVDHDAENQKSNESSAASIGMENGLRLKSCLLCGEFFYTLSDQRDHFRSENHIQNLKLNMDQTSQDDEEENLSQAPNDVSGKLVLLKSSKIGKGIALYKMLLTDQEEHTNSTEALREKFIKFVSESRTLYFMILLLSGGRFAGAIFDVKTGQMVRHKTFYRYTVRRKQGGSQRAQDGTGRKPKSVGSTIRRQNEVLLDQDVRSWLNEQKDMHCERIFMFAPGRYNKETFFDDPKNFISRTDRRLHWIPFTVYRPTLDEVKRVFSVITQVKIVDLDNF